MIPWAASVEPAAAFTPFSARRKVVWAGPLQCSAADELGLTAAAMATLPRALPDAEPEVWPKPEFVSAYSKIAQAFALPVHVANSGFLDDLSRVKVLVSPVPSSDYIVAPPLTWLEAVESGCVVVTTPCRGLPTQLVESGGIVVARNCSVPALNEAIAKAWHSAGPAVKRMPTARAAAARYAELWRMHDRL